MALVPIKTSARTGYCDCICGCYDPVSLRDEETGKSSCPRCAKEHLEMNQGLGISAASAFQDRPEPARPRETGADANARRPARTPALIPSPCPFAAIRPTQAAI